MPVDNAEFFVGKSEEVIPELIEKGIKPVDMFPQTSHVEEVTLLVKE